jgi:hypothetical protein
MHGETNTWGAYQCYGDPSFSLTTGRTRVPDEQFVSESELCIWLDGHAAKGRQQGPSPQLLAELETRASQAPAAWWTSAALCARAGRAFEACGEFQRATDYYARVLQAEKATAPITALEHLACCRTRWAGALVSADPASAARARTLLEQAETELRHLLALGATAERSSLLGAVMKRRAMLPGLGAAGRRAALREMSKAYGDAYDVSRRNGAGEAAILANRIAADLVRSWSSAPLEAGIPAAIQELQQLASALAATRADTCTLAARGDALLLAAMHERRLTDAALDDIAEAFAPALSHGAPGAVSASDSLRTQVQFFRRMVETELPKPARPELIRQLKRLEERLLPTSGTTPDEGVRQPRGGDDGASQARGDLHAV